MKVLAYEGISPISRLIRFQTRYAVSHVAMEMSDGSVWEAWHKGGVVRRDNFRQGHTSGTTVRVYDYVDIVDESKALAFWEQHEGDKYDFRNVIRFIPRLKPKPNDQWYCSEAVAKSSFKAGTVLQKEQCDLLSPRDICISPKLLWAHRITRTV